MSVSKRKLPGKPLDAAVSVWRTFVKQGGIEPSRRDASLVAELRDKLSLPPKGSFERQLAERSIGTSELITKLIQAVAPFGQMMSDLMSLFDAGGASASDQNLAIEFNFDEKKPAFKFDLHTFRKWAHVWKDVRETRSVPVWDHDRLRRLCQVLEGQAGEDSPAATDNVVARWLSDYEGGRWRAWTAQPIVFGSDAMRVAINEVWSIWQRVVEESRRFGETRDELSRHSYEPRFTDVRDREADDRATPVSQAWILGNLDAEHWAGRMLRSLAALANRREINADTEVAIISTYENVPRRDLQVAERVRMLVEFLQLPVWQERNELYSAWISTQIVAALGVRTRVHSSEGKLVFSFRGSHLASSDLADETTLHLWAEMRSPLVKPRGKGRSKSIQPDYCVLTEPVTFPESALLAVEVKHYLGSARGSFAAAMEDYARGRPKAQVILVSHGRVSRTVTDAIEKKVRGRCAAIGEFMPGNESALSEFQRLTQTALRAVTPASPTSSSEATEKEAIVSAECTGNAEQGRETAAIVGHDAAQAVDKIVLRWSSMAQDLDLHVWVYDADGRTHICFDKRGGRIGPPYAELDKDCRSLPGEETVQLAVR